MGVTQHSFAGAVLEMPDEWLLEQTDEVLTAVLAVRASFASNLIIARSAAKGAAQHGEEIPGALVLHRGPFDGPLQAEEIVLGYPGPTTPLTTVQLIADGIVITFTADADRFEEDWSAVRGVLETWRSA